MKFVLMDSMVTRPVYQERCNFAFLVIVTEIPIQMLLETAIVPLENA